MAATIGDQNAVMKDLTMIAEDELTQVRPSLYPLITSVKPEDGAYTKIAIDATMPFPKKFEGERQALGKDVTVVQNYNQGTYELTIDIDSDLVRNAKAYSFDDLIREGSTSMELFPDYFCSQAVIAGNANNCYDGNPYYGATHAFAAVANAPNYSNTVQATGTTVTQIAADIQTAMAQLKGVKTNQGQLYNQQAAYGASQILFQIPLALEANFRTVINGSFIPVATPVTTSGTAAAPASNVAWQGIGNLYADGYLDSNSATRWYMHYVGRAQRPFVFLENYKTILKVLGFNTEFEANTGKVRFAWKRRFSLGYYRPERSVRVG